MYDFLLVSQKVRQGTVTPVHYNIIYDTTNLDADKFQQLTYKLTHLYFNWPGKYSCYSNYRSFNSFHRNRASTSPMSIRSQTGNVNWRSSSSRSCRWEFMWKIILPLSYNSNMASYQIIDRWKCQNYFKFSTFWFFLSNRIMINMS